MLINILPNWILFNLSIYGMIIIGYLVERKFVSRISLFANSLALNSFFFQRRDILNIHPILPLYVDLGLIWGVIGIFKYYEYFHGHNYKPLPKWYYKIGWLYSSISVALLLLFLQMNFPA